jgi:hypothetical protein
MALPNVAQQFSPMLDTEGDKIQARLGVIVGLQTNGSTVMLIGVIFHGDFP